MRLLGPVIQRRRPPGTLWRPRCQLWQRGRVSPRVRETALLLPLDERRRVEGKLLS
jgi:hypothetical protein